ncbi:acyltransferase [Microtetraspora sp. NBRC 13810]|uniref:acyltransferase family protein n=1 Tax=Microtetraspora sp. NBRC 13810 TaxID=3030990 RepID=UPI0025561C3E|nr:acyltransferase [Microtetraspora sp. NBRC 13810]
MPAQLNSLTGLRWVAAFMVFLTHALQDPVSVPPGGLGEAINATVVMAGSVGVSVFFVLSGFVLTWSVRTSDTAAKFWRRRFFKIYPNYLVAFGVAVLFIAWMGASVGYPSLGEQASAVVPQLLLLQAWSSDLGISAAFNTVGWTLSIEAMFYLCFPFLLVLLNRIRPERLWYWVGGMVVLIFCFPQLTRLLPAGEPVFWGLNNWEMWFVYMFPLTRMAEFVIGILLARILLTGKWINLPLWAAALVFVAGYVVMLNVPTLYAIAAATIIPIILLIAAAATVDIRGRRSLLATRPMVWLGNISYAFYLLHVFAITLVFYVIGLDFQATSLSAVGFFAVSLALAVVASWLLYELVEKPIQRRFATKRERPGPLARPVTDPAVPQPQGGSLQ